MQRRSTKKSSTERRGPQKAADIVAQLMARRGYGRLQASAITAEAWTAAAGEKFAGNTRPGELKRGKLEIHVRNSAVLQELTFAKKKILKALLASMPEAKISDLKFRVGSVE